MSVPARRRSPLPPVWGVGGRGKVRHPVFPRRLRSQYWRGLTALLFFRNELRSLRHGWPNWQPGPCRTCKRGVCSAWLYVSCPPDSLYTGQTRRGQGSAASRDRIAPSRRDSCVLESSARTKGELLRKVSPAPSARKSPSSMLGRCGGTGQIVPVAYLPQGDESGIDSAPRGHRHGSPLQLVS